MTELMLHHGIKINRILNTHINVAMLDHYRIKTKAKVFRAENKDCCIIITCLFKLYQVL